MKTSNSGLGRRESKSEDRDEARSLQHQSLGQECERVRENYQMCIWRLPNTVNVQVPSAGRRRKSNPDPDNPDSNPCRKAEGGLSRANKTPRPEQRRIPQNPTSRSTSSLTMAAGQKLYPRATVKKIVKAHSKRNVTKNVDVLVSLVDASPQKASLMKSRYSSTTRSSFKRTRFSLLSTELLY
jgi:hypothetical protein